VFYRQYNLTLRQTINYKPQESVWIKQETFCSFPINFCSSQNAFCKPLTHWKELHYTHLLFYQKIATYRLTGVQLSHIGIKGWRHQITSEKGRIAKLKLRYIIPRTDLVKLPYCYTVIQNVLRSISSVKKWFTSQPMRIRCPRPPTNWWRQVAGGRTMNPLRLHRYDPRQGVGGDPERVE
jgi:hypothetical protein